MKSLLTLGIALLFTATFSFAQNLPLAGGNLTGPVTGPSFVQTGTVFDYAPGAQLTTNGTNANGGAHYRSFNSITSLGLGQYLILDIGSGLPVDFLSFGTHWSSDPRFIPTAYTIDYSNDLSSWTNLVTVTGNTNLHPVYGVGVSARYWRLTVNGLYSGFTTANITGFQLITTGVGAAGNNYWNSVFDKNNIFSNSPVSIGTANTYGYMLAVNGKIRATEIKVEASPWPDYVFKPTYELKPLSEVKTYIDKNQHLPGMPSAAEVEKNGLNLGETNALMLKKIEELTLYLIEKDKQLDEQRKINQSVIKRLAEIERSIKKK